jgi:hypothetical protein
MQSFVAMVTLAQDDPAAVELFASAAFSGYEFEVLAVEVVAEPVVEPTAHLDPPHDGGVPEPGGGLSGSGTTDTQRCAAARCVLSYDYGEAMVMGAPEISGYPADRLLRLTAATGCWQPIVKNGMADDVIMKIVGWSGAGPSGSSAFIEPNVFPGDFATDGGICFVAPPTVVPEGLVNTQWVPNQRDCEAAVGRMDSGPDGLPPAVWCGDAAPVIDPSTLPGSEARGVGAVHSKFVYVITSLTTDHKVTTSVIIQHTRSP